MSRYQTRSKTGASKSENEACRETDEPTPSMLVHDQANNGSSHADRDFKQFCRLPADLRLQIWRTAASLPSSTPGVCYFHSTGIISGNGSTPSRCTYDPLIVHEPVNRALLATNTEAYDVAMEASRRAATRPYDPAIDILFITDWASFEHFTGTVCGFNGEEWIERIQHLALPLNRADAGLWLPIAMSRLRSLKTLSVVYPAATGRFNFSASVPLPKDRSTPLRLMTEAERKGVVIAADYMYGTPFGEFPVQWESDVDQHLEMIEENLVRDTRPSGHDEDDEMFGRKPPIWDHKAERLALTYQARVFEPVKLRVKNFRDKTRDVVG